MAVQVEINNIINEISISSQWKGSIRPISHTPVQVLMNVHPQCRMNSYINQKEHKLMQCKDLGKKCQFEYDKVYNIGAEQELGIPYLCVFTVQNICSSL